MSELLHDKRIIAVGHKTIGLLLAFTLLLSCAGFGWAVELSHPCTVTVRVDDSAYAEALQAAELTVDLYQIAAATERPGEDAYGFQLLAPFTALALEQEDPTALARSAAWLAVTEGTPLVTEAPAEQPITQTDSGEPLGPGLYLMLVHLRGATQYTVPAETPEELLATFADVGDDRFLFSPELLSVPTRVDADGNPTGTTAAGEWQYDVTVRLKLERSPRFGAIEIVKRLLSCAEDQQGLFVFSVDAVLDGMTVFSDVFCLRFDEAGQKSLRIDRLPVGATVTVTEAYSGVSYALASDATQTLVIDAETLQSVEFVNEYAGTPDRGNGIDNCFVYDAQTGWACTQDPALGG